MSQFFAFALPLILFIYLSVIGYAAITLLYSQKNILQNALLSPAIGVAIILLSVFWLNHVGLPVKYFATYLSLFLFLASTFILILRKTIFPFKQYRAFFIILLLALWLSGRPLLYFGFDWISYANDDMANYCLGALRFLNHGYSAIPNTSELIQGKDYSQFYWFTFVPGMIRSGSELLLAWLSGITQLTPLQIFMPLILTFHLILVSVTGGLVLFSKKWKKLALITCLLLSGSALTTLGTLYELIAQVIGLAFLITASLLLFQLFHIKNSKQIITHALLLTIIFCALLITYPEVIPLSGAAFLLYFTIMLLQGWRPRKVFLQTGAVFVGLSLLFLNRYWMNIIAFLQYQATAGLAEHKGNLFPYFLIPSGFANLWNLQTIAIIPHEPWLSFSILLGVILSFLTILIIMTLIPKRNPAAIIAAIMILVAMYLVLHLKLHSGFSLFKLAMYIQPFLLATIAIGLFKNASFKKTKLFLIVLLLVPSLYTQNNYVQYSFGTIGTPFNELPNGSENHLAGELIRLRQSIPPGVILNTDSTNIVASKIQALSFYQSNLILISNSFFDKFLFTGSSLFKKAFSNDYATARDIKAIIEKSNIKLPFYLQEKNNLASYFTYTKLSPLNQKSVMILETSLRSVFNRSKQGTPIHQNYIASPIEQIQNHLVFINSSLGQYYYFGENPNISLYNLEKDFYFPTESMAGLGRYLLFNIINPTQKMRLVINFTTTLNHDGNNQLPHATIISDKQYAIPMMGRGSAHIVTLPFQPKIINHLPYFMIDMGTPHTAFNSMRGGLMKWYGQTITLDTRQLVGFCRDISLISDEDYRKFIPPSALNQFPTDLSNPNLEYTGIYEDGWIAEDALLVLSQPKTKHFLTIKGCMPQMARNQFSVFIDEHKAFNTNLSTGHFNIQIPVVNKSTHKIKLHFADIQSLPQGDLRPVAAKLEFIGFT